MGIALEVLLVAPLAACDGEIKPFRFVTEGAVYGEGVGGTTFMLVDVSVDDAAESIDANLIWRGVLACDAAEAFVVADTDDASDGEEERVGGRGKFPLTEEEDEEDERCIGKGDTQFRVVSIA